MGGRVGLANGAAEPDDDEEEDEEEEGLGAAVLFLRPRKGSVSNLPIPRPVAEPNMNGVVSVVDDDGVDAYAAPSLPMEGVVDEVEEEEVRNSSGGLRSASVIGERLRALLLCSSYR